MSDDVEQKKHEASGRHLDHLRGMGQSLRSKDLSGGLLLITAILIMMLMCDRITDQFISNFKLSFHSIATSKTPYQVTQVFEKLSVDNLLLLMPLFVVVFTVPFLSVFILGGWNFSIKAVSFKWEKLDPIRNLSSIYSKRMFFEVAKSFLKFFLIFGIFYYFISSNLTILYSLSYARLSAVFHEFYYMMQQFILSILLGVIVIMLVDSLYSYFSYFKNAKMTSEEVKEEHKQAEGNSDVKRKIKSMQMSIMRQKVNVMVPTATVIITNPQHYAVALRYDDRKDKSPKVIAKGKGPVALYIRKIAAANYIPIYEEPPLARAIYHTTKVNAEINPALYMAVAIVLTYINQLKRYQVGMGSLPRKAASIPIPEEFRFNA